jgi:hypothetical protein
MPAAPHPADVHLGDPAEVIAAGMTAAFDTVVQAVAALDLRPSAVEVHRQLGLTDVAVYFPHADTASVDELADRFRLPALLDAGVMYCRRGLAELGDVEAFSLAVRSARPDVELPDPLAAAATPRVITGELAPISPAQLALPAAAA